MSRVLRNRMFYIYVVGGLGGFFLLFAVSTMFFSSQLLQINSPRALRILIQRFAPPKDLYDFLVNEKIGPPNETVKVTFENKYSGIHGIGVLFPNSPRASQLKGKPPLLKAEVNCYIGSNLVLSRKIGGDSKPFIGRDGSGFVLDTYASPGDLPLSKPITCEVKFLETDSELENIYGPANFYIRKMPDE